MIVFATLFLGLILGPQDVEVVVGEEVATVEILLDGRTLGTLGEPPWTLRCDFGRELVPRELVAVARDGDGRELGRARQWLNLPQPPAQVTIALEGGGDQQRFAHLSWESRTGAWPQHIEVSFDGRTIAVNDPHHIALPPHDERQLHFLRAELEFSDHVATVAEITFGGTYAEEVSTELSAIPVRLEGRRRLKDPADLQGLVLTDGEPLRIVAVEKGTAQIIVIPESNVYKAFDDLGRVRFAGRRLSEARLRAAARFGVRQYVRFLWPTGERQAGQRHDYDLFPTSREYDDTSGLYLMLLHAFQEPYWGGQERLADAVAVAGLHAAEQRQRRTVVLLLSGEPTADDASQLQPGEARRYLESLHVPFYIWSFGGKTADPRWGEVRDVSSLGKFERAVNETSRLLERQRLVWVDGIHLPQKITLAPRAEGIELVP